MAGIVAAGSAVVDMVVAVGSTVDVEASEIAAIVAADIADTGMGVAALLIPLTTLHITLSIWCVYVVQRNP